MGHRYQLDSALEQLTPAERAERGKEARAAVPRDSHAVFDPPPDRADPVGLLEEQAKTRVPELVPVRWGRMMVSPFTYYRGAALPMATDLAATPTSGLAHADVDQLQAEFDSQMKKHQRKVVKKDLAKARTHDSMQEVAKLTHLVDGRPRIIADPPLIVPITDLAPKQMDRTGIETQLNDLIAKYQRTLETDRRFLLETYEVADMARKVVGVGSVGTRCWIILMLGGDESDPLFLQVKEADKSVLAAFAYLGGSDVFDQAVTKFAAAYADQNERDHQSLVDAIASGRITAEPGV